MYLFFDKNGTLLEIVNDSALRQYNQDANKMYVYIQDEDGSISGKIDPDIVGLTHRYLKANRKIVDNCPQIERPSDGTKYKDGVFEYKEIPFNRKRDLKHFSYGRKYEFFVVDVPSGRLTPVDYEEDGAETVEFVTEGTVFDVAGTVLATLTAVYKESSNLVLERFAFTVEESVPTTDGALTGSQFTWLIGELIRLNSRVEGHYDYDKQNNRPIVNVDMNSSDFIAKASNYYRHIGENSAEHRNGLIYYCPEDGTLVEIDGGTSLNLNGQYTEEATVYAPTNGGDNTGVKVLVPHGEGEEPTWERLSVSSSGSVTSAGVTYSIKLGGNSAGTITLPKETYIEDITFNGSTKIVTFKYNGESGRGEKTVDLSELVDVYTAGNGLQKSGNEFSIKTNSSYLSTSSQGLSVNASSIAGLAQIYLNGSRKTANSNQFYAPTKYHTSNSDLSCWVLVPNGINTAPIWERIYVEKSGLTYTLKLGNYIIGKIELTQEIYLDDVKYNSDTNKLVFTYNTASGQTAIEVDLTDLVDMYDAGLGLEKVGNKFNVKIAPDSEKYLKATAEGLVFDESALPTQGATGNGGAFIAKTEDEMTALLKPENVGALVSYMGEGGGAATVNPTAVGDTVTQVYFDTTKSAEEVYNALMQLDWDNPDGTDDEGGVMLTLFSAGEIGVERQSVLAIKLSDIYGISAEGNLLFVYSPSMEPSALEMEQWGWTNTSPYSVETSFAIGYIEHKDIWGSFLSAHENGFASGSASAYKKDSVYLVTEFKPKHSDIKAGDTIDTLYFNTSVTPDFEAIKASSSIIKGADIHVDWANAYFVLAFGTESGEGGGYLGFQDMSEMQEGLWALMSFGSDGIIYLSQDVPAEITGGDPFPAGWQMDSINVQEAFDGEVSVAQIGGQEVWGAYISKEPFTSGEEESAPKIIAKQICEEIENEVATLSKEITGLNSSVEGINERVTELENTEISHPKAHRFNTLCDSWVESGNNVHPYRAKVCSYDSSRCYLITPHTASSAKTCEDIGVCFADGDSGYIWVYTKTQPENVYTHIMFTITSFECDSVSTNGEVYFSFPSVGGGNLSDVQVNGTSVVADGIANIPYASKTEGGIVTIGNQTFAGKKYFSNGICLSGDSMASSSAYVNLYGGPNEELIVKPNSGSTYDSCFIKLKIKPSSSVERGLSIGLFDYVKGQQTWPVIKYWTNASSSYNIYIPRKQGFLMTSEEELTSEASGKTLAVNSNGNVIVKEPFSYKVDDDGWTEFSMDKHAYIYGKRVEIKAEVTEITNEGTDVEVKTQYFTGPVIFPGDYVASGQTGQCRSTTIVVNSIKLFTNSMGIAEADGIDGAKYYYRIIN